MLELPALVEDTGSGDNLVVLSLTATGRIAPIYNLSVADWHTFMVGEDRAVVHNACPPLKRLHPRETLISGRYVSSYRHWSSQSTEAIVKSLQPGSAEGELTVRSDGMVFEGNTRILVLEERGYPVNSLPRVLLNK